MHFGSQDQDEGMSQTMHAALLCTQWNPIEFQVFLFGIIILLMPKFRDLKCLIFCESELENFGA